MRKKSIEQLSLSICFWTFSIIFFLSFLCLFLISFTSAQFRLFNPNWPKISTMQNHHVSTTPIYPKSFRIVCARFNKKIVHFPILPSTQNKIKVKFLLIFVQNIFLYSFPLWGRAHLVCPLVHYKSKFCWVFFFSFYCRPDQLINGNTHSLLFYARTHKHTDTPSLLARKSISYFSFLFV